MVLKGIQTESRSYLGRFQWNKHPDAHFYSAPAAGRSRPRSSALPPRRHSSGCPCDETGAMACRQSNQTPFTLGSTDMVSKVYIGTSKYPIPTKPGRTAYSNGPWGCWALLNWNKPTLLLFFAIASCKWQRCLAKTCAPLCLRNQREQHRGRHHPPPQSRNGTGSTHTHCHKHTPHSSNSRRFCPSLHQPCGNCA